MTLVVVGAGVAGLSAAEAARKAGYTQRIVLIGEETHLPYDRPPLSKQVLTGEWDLERVALRRPESYADRGIELQLNCRAERLRLEDKVVQFAGGHELAYDKLVIATGVRPASLPFGNGVDNVRVLRTVEDALALRAQLGPGRRLVVIGAGFLGTEVAACARAAGTAVTVIDALAEPMSRTLGDWIGARVRRLHEEQGVTFRLGVGVHDIRVEGARATAVALNDGAIVPADCVLVAVGSRPNVDWLDGTGLATSAGVICDQYCLATDDISAAGDLAAWHHPGLDRLVHVEHRMNAQEQGALAGLNVVSQPADRKSFAPVPYFWSDQYDTKIQAYGTLPADADTSLAVGDPDAGRFVITYRQRGRLVGAVGWNAPKETRAYRALIAEGSTETADERPLTRV